MMENSQKIIVAVTGASGSIYAKNLLERLISAKNKPGEVALIFSETGQKVWNYEVGNIKVESTIIKEYQNDDFFSPAASGSAGYDGMVIIPCTMGTLGRIASVVSDDLIGRAADVMLKERKKLILVARETPLSLIHIENMKTITLAGGIIYPASPSFYSRPQSIDEAVNTVVDRIINMLGFEVDLYRWGSAS